MAYRPDDPARPGAGGRVVLFGGTVGGSQTLDDTWTWEGATWHRESTPVSPPPLAGAALAYHAASGKLVLFGGGPFVGLPLAETWTWDGARWEKQAPPVSPPARRAAAMAEHDASGRVVLFGGLGYEAGAWVRDGTTWTWDGTTWRHESPTSSRPRREDHAMAYHGPTERTVLFGGANFGLACGPVRDVTEGGQSRVRRVS